MLNWAITFLLLGFVSIFFIVIGTSTEVGSLLARLATVGFLVLAAAMFAGHAKHRSGEPGAS